MKFKLFILFGLLFQVLETSAQSFKWQANLEKVSSSGFYNIALTPDIVSKTEDENFADIRIFEKSREIAYLLRKQTDSTDTAGNKYFKVSNYTLIPALSFKTAENKTSKQSIVKLDFDKAYQIDKLILTIEGFKYYLRTAWLAELNPDFKNKRNRNEYTRLTDFTISSEKPAIIDLPEGSRHKQLYLFIENEDNSPLRFKKIEALQRNMHLTTYLEKDKLYVIKAGQSNMNLPRYDLDYFNDSIGNSLPFIKTGNFNAIHVEPKTNKVTSDNKSWIWIALTLLIGLIGYLSYNMIGEIQRKK